MPDEQINPDEQVDQSLVEELNVIQKSNKQPAGQPAQIPTNPIPLSDIKYASFGSRLVAVIIDWVILGIINWISPFQAFGFDLGYIFYRDPLEILFSIVGFLIPVAYFAGMHTWRGQTVGKMAMRIKVVGPNQSGLSLGRAIGRSFARILSGLVIFLGYLSMLWDKKKQTWHDHLAHTFVIKIK